ncbi:hypothetical protein ACG33_10141 [Steroidobacter denitrificans]|uniref:Glycosyltransferase subfamily 4-like N-terminal domain-containing protein n=1 Tax=Steroidobacter denitrificans TaxID=465721 RepID=A0A127FCW2_STEDE|nr:glycosyltransferase [Steroidobacter denitrificans]AMN47451.1 hypothetical protein ACG33_10141 [Steroidobacter denitrificans]
MSNVLFLTWIQHRRTRHLCERLDIPLVELVSKRRGIFRYIELTIRTLQSLKTRRPRVLIVQSPSVVLSLLCLLLRSAFRYRLIIDAHNEAVEPYLHSSILMRFITRLILNKSDTVIVTNKQLANRVAQQGGHPIILPDGIPTPPPVTKIKLNGRFNIVLISTFAGDEPFNIVVDAMHLAEPEIQLYVTGNPEKLTEKIRNSLPENITLTGFLSENNYWSILASANAIMDLTTMDNCLVCGAYEAIALEQPLLLSKNAASMELFSDFAVFTTNTTQGLISAINQLRLRHQDIRTAFPIARQLFEKKWNAHAEELLRLTRPSDF